MLSEWSTFLTEDADNAFCAGANLAAILAAQAAIETHLRFEYADIQETRHIGFYDLIENSPIPEELKADLHKLRKYRNKWVHGNDPKEDDDLVNKPEYFEAELEEMARFAIRALGEVLYLEQWLCAATEKTRRAPRNKHTRTTGHARLLGISADLSLSLPFRRAVAAYYTFSDIPLYRELLGSDTNRTSGKIG